MSGDIPKALKSDMEEGGVILASAHLGFWELLPAVLPSHFPKKRSLFLYRPLRNERVDALIKHQRSFAGAIGVAQQPRILDTLADELTNGACVAILPDVRPSRSGVRVRFLASERELPPGLAVLRLRSGAPVWLTLVLAADHPDGMRSGTAFSFVFLRILPRRKIGDVQLSAEAIMQAYANALCPFIAAYPLQYLWSHNMTAKPA